jgi:tetratricopeptide (TPR) repeat protein
MSFPAAVPFPETRWQAERGHWGSYFEGLVRAQLKWATGFVRAHKPTPHQLKPRFHSLLALLTTAHPHPALHPLALELISALHPLPVWWGYWTAWEPELRFAIKTAAALGSLSTQAEFTGYLAALQLSVGLIETAIQTGEQALDLARRAGNVPLLIEAGAVTLTAQRLMGQINQARELHALLKAAFTNAALSFSETARLVAQARLDMHTAHFLRSAGKLTDALALLDTLVQRIEPARAAFAQPPPDLLAGVYTDRATLHWARGAYAQAITDLRQALMCYEKVGEEAATATTWGNLGLVYWSMAAFDLAESALRKSITLTEHLNAHQRLTNEVGNMGLVYLARGELHLAATYISRQLALAEETGFITERHRAIGNRGIVRLHLGEYAAAIEDLHADIELTRHRSQEGLGCAYTALSWCLLGQGKGREGEEYARQALRLGEDMHSPGLRIIALRCLAEFQSGAEKSQTLQTALALARAHQRRLDEAACLLSLAGVTPPPEAMTYWDEGVVRVHQIGAAPWLAGHAPENPPRLALLL